MDTAQRFRARHHEGGVLLLPNAWDIGSARLFASLGFEAVATTSSGFAATLGRLDGAVTREEALAHVAALAGAVDLPVSADLERGFADDPEGVAATVRAVAEAGAAGGSIEDFTGRPDTPIYDLGLARERMAAAAEAAHGDGVDLVLTGRAENHLHGVDDLDDTIRRLQAYQEAGADVLYAPGLTTLEQVRAVVSSVDRPVNVLLVPGGPSVPELAEVGVRRVSVGGAFAFAALGAAVEAARELLEHGTTGYLQLAGVGRTAVRAAFTG